MKEEGSIFDELLKETEPLKEKLVYELSKLLYDKKKLYMITDFNIEQINLFYKMCIMDRLFYQKYCTKAKIKKYFKELFDLLPELLISKDRKSRMEILTMFTDVKAKVEREGLRDRLFRR